MDFSELQEANNRRAKEWLSTNSTDPWFAVLELAGEVGEAVNKFKKMVRFENGMKGGEPCLEDFKDEIADVVICCSLVARKFNFDLGEAVRAKFNKTSDKHGFTTKL